MIQPILSVRWARGQPLIFCKWSKTVSSSLTGWFLFCFVLFDFWKASRVTSAPDNDAYPGSDVLEHLNSWEFCFLFINFCSSPCQSHQPNLLTSPMEDWKSHETQKGRVCGRTWPRDDFLWPALTCGSFFSSRVWHFPHPAALVCRIYARQAPAEIIAGLVLVSSFGGMMLQVFRVWCPS